MHQKAVVSPAPRRYSMQKAIVIQYVIHHRLFLLSSKYLMRLSLFANLGVGIVGKLAELEIVVLLLNFQKKQLP